MLDRLRIPTPLLLALAVVAAVAALLRALGQMLPGTEDLSVSALVAIAACLAWLTLLAFIRDRAASTDPGSLPDDR
jgi:hypothetical protein